MPASVLSRSTLLPLGSISGLKCRCLFTELLPAPTSWCQGPPLLTAASLCLARAWHTTVSNEYLWGQRTRLFHPLHRTVHLQGEVPVGHASRAHSHTGEDARVCQLHLGNPERLGRGEGEREAGLVETAPPFCILSPNSLQPEGQLGDTAQAQLWLPGPQNQAPAPRPARLPSSPAPSAAGRPASHVPGPPRPTPRAAC